MMGNMQETKPKNNAKPEPLGVFYVPCKKRLSLLLTCIMKQTIKEKKNDTFKPHIVEVKVN